MRYRRFLHLQTLYPTLLLEPPLDVALILLSHQVIAALTRSMSKVSRVRMVRAQPCCDPGPI